MKNNPLKFGRLFALILVLVHLSVWAQPLEAWFMPRSGTAQPVAFLQKTSIPSCLHLSMDFHTACILPGPRLE